MNTARREFMGGMLALGACGCRATGWFGSFGARMRMGVLSDFHLPAAKLVDRVAFTFAAEDLPTKGGHYRFEVRPLECFGRKGEAIVSNFVDLSAVSTSGNAS